MTDQRTMRTFLDLVAERDEALGEATRLADLLADCETLATMAAGVTLGIARKCGLQVEFRDDAARTPESGPLAAERPDPFHGHHPEHSTPQEGTQ